ncbi:MAG: hypothetical protein ACOCQR_02160 [bacterium]
MKTKLNNLIVIFLLVLTFIIVLSSVIFAEDVSVYLFKGVAVAPDGTQAQSKYIPARTKITEDMLLKTTIPKEAKHSLAIIKPEMIIGAYTVTDVYTGQQVIAPVISQNDMASHISYYIKPGKNAFTIPLADIKYINEEISINDRINITAHFERLGDYDITLTDTFLYNVRVLDIKTDAKKPTITVELSSNEIEYMMYILNEAKSIAFTLRGLETSIIETQGITTEAFLESFGYQIGTE